MGSERMPDLDLPALRAVIAGVRERVNAATPGPWEWMEFPLARDGRHECGLTNGTGKGVLFHQAHWGVHEADAALIASAPSDLTTLADACERLAEENERLRGEVARLRKAQPQPAPSKNYTLLGGAITPAPAGKGEG